jgi:hypothetical protein
MVAVRAGKAVSTWPTSAAQRLAISAYAPFSTLKVSVPIGLALYGCNRT